MNWPLAIEVSGCRRDRKNINENFTRGGQSRCYLV